MLRKYEQINENAKEDGIELVKENLELSKYYPSYEFILTRKEEVLKLRELVKEADKKYNRLKREKNILSMDDYLNNFEKVGDVSVLISEIENKEVNEVKDLADRLADKVDNSVIFFGIKMLDKVIFVCKNKSKQIECWCFSKRGSNYY